MVDRGLEIDEGDETNNEAVMAVEIMPKQTSDDTSSSELRLVTVLSTD